MDFTNKQYEDFWEYDDSPFKDYGDNENFWIVVHYLISRNSFVPEMGKSLTDLTASNGKKIFRGKVIDFSKYKVIDYSKDFADSAKSIYRVTEVYGYAPNKTYTEFDRVNFNYPSYEKEVTATAISITTATYDKRNGYITIAMTDAESKFQPGDLVVLSKGPGTYNGEQIYPQTTPEATEVMAVNTDSIVIKDTYCVTSVSGIESSGLFVVGDDGFCFFTRAGDRSITKKFDARRWGEDQSFTSTAEVKIEYVDVSAGDISFSDPFQVKLGGTVKNIWGYQCRLSKYTRPTVDDYLAKIGSTEKLLARQESMERYRGVIWKKIAYFVPYR